MDIGLVKECYSNGHFCIHESAGSWEEAVRESIEPLILDGSVSPEYADRTIAMVREYGPYICVCPHVCIPHAMAPELVNNVSLSFMKLNEPIKFSDDPNESAELFFALASPNTDDHLRLLSELADLLSDDEAINALLNAKTEEMFKELLSE